MKWCFYLGLLALWFLWSPTDFMIGMAICILMNLFWSARA